MTMSKRSKNGLTIRIVHPVCKNIQGALRTQTPTTSKRFQVNMVLKKAGLLLLVFFAATTVSNAGFSSNVVSLNPKTWKELEKSPHTWFVNFCREG